MKKTLVEINECYYEGLSNIPTEDNGLKAIKIATIICCACHKSMPLLALRWDDGNKLYKFSKFTRSTNPDVIVYDFYRDSIETIREGLMHKHCLEAYKICPID